MQYRRLATPSLHLLLCIGVIAWIGAQPGLSEERSWLQKLRELFGYNPLLAPGGVRASNGQPTQPQKPVAAQMPVNKSWLDSLKELDLPMSSAFHGRGPNSQASPRSLVCLITPRLRNSEEPATALLALPNPTILSQNSLAEWRLEDRQGALLRKGKAQAGELLRWPLPPLQPGQMIILRVRAASSDPDAWVTVRLQAADAAAQARAQTLLGEDRDRLGVVKQQLQQSKPSLALELLFAPTKQASPELLALRSYLVSSGCDPGG